MTGLKRLLNPDFIQEIGTYHCDERGFACSGDVPGAEERTFVLMTGGHDPIDVVESPWEVACLKARWAKAWTLYVAIDDEGEVAYEREAAR